jgi:hypothetical protein
MLRFALAISNTGIFLHLKDEEVKNWEANAYLRYMRRIPFHNGKAQLDTKSGTYILTLEPETGLTISRKGVLAEE